MTTTTNKVMLKCPACSSEFEKLSKGGLCPKFECRTPLKLVDFENDQGVVTRTAVFRKHKESFNEEDVEIYEVIFNRDSVKVQKSNKGAYIVTFYHRRLFNWIYCPSCESKMFQNNYLSGSFEHKCHKCKAVTTYVFS